MNKIFFSLITCVFCSLIPGTSIIISNQEVSAQEIDNRDPLIEEADRLNQQAIQLYKQGKYQDATNLFERALEIRKRLFPEDHSLVATSLNNLAALYRNQGRYAEAEPPRRKRGKIP